ncbi:hypothetical protein [Rhodococcus erythropolis]|uniref:hypothetical protein n=1 Tax=Rhodococcus erythropolis TaxID=1833 RepID=UPI001412CD89|nr:hypothetical protein [Rhodococcus erythropolis]
MTGVDVEHTKALTDAEIDADLVGDGGMYFEPDAGYPEYGNGTVRWAYRLGHEAGAAAVPALVAAVERVQAQVDKALEILDRYNHSDDGNLPECAPEDRWRLYRDLLATLNPEALESP